MRNDLSALPWAKNQLHVVENYFEALGVMGALKSGVAVDTLKRPLVNAQVRENAFSAGIAEPASVSVTSACRSYSTG